MEHSPVISVAYCDWCYCYCRGYSSQWDVFFDQIQPLTTSMPYMTVPGNHERDWPNSGDRFPAQYDSGGECGVPYNRRLKMPSPAEDKPWYSFDFGPIHFLQYSTEHDFAQGEHRDHLGTEIRGCLMLAWYVPQATHACNAECLYESIKR